MKKAIIHASLCLLPIAGISGQTAPVAPTGTLRTELFVTTADSVHPYRIPAIARANDGTLIAVSDYRPCNSDIGYGRVDLVSRLSHDGGRTWTPETAIRRGTGVAGASDCGFGDAAIVADNRSNEVLLVSVCGNTPYFSATRDNPNRVSRWRSHDGGRTWSSGEEITESIYSIFDKSRMGAVKSLFFGSGRICQSRIVKRGKYFRLYAALAARDGGNRVIYSDDFGESWNSLGSIDMSPVPKGDEPKCEEFPDGSVIVSSRTYGGRFFNIFRYSDVKRGLGTWGSAAFSSEKNNGTAAAGNACNGEILVVPAKRTADGAPTYLLLQSVPFGPGRTCVGIYYKEIDDRSIMRDPSALAADWDGKYQVTRLPSAYSTMTTFPNGDLAFFYEETTHGKDYTNVFVRLDIATITQGRYTSCPKASRKAFLRNLEKAARSGKVTTKIRK